MAKKMIRKLVMIFALLLLVGSQVNADCQSDCSSQYSACWNQALALYEMCISNPCYDQCVLMCYQWGGTWSYCENNFCPTMCPNPDQEECAEMAWAALEDCDNAYSNCLDACY